MLTRQKRYFLGYRTYFLGAAVPRTAADGAQKRTEAARKDDAPARLKRRA